MNGGDIKMELFGLIWVENITRQLIPPPPPDPKESLRLVGDCLVSIY